MAFSVVVVQNAMSAVKSLANITDDRLGFCTDLSSEKCGSNITLTKIVPKILYSYDFFI